MALDINYSCPIIRFSNISSKYDEKIYLFQSVLSCLCLIKFLFAIFSYFLWEPCDREGNGLEENQPIESLDRSCPVQLWRATLKNINFAFRKIRQKVSENKVQNRYKAILPYLLYWACTRGMYNLIKAMGPHTPCGIRVGMELFWRPARRG